VNARWLFVYGTLMPGHYNYPMVERALLMPPFTRAVARGRMYHVEGTGPDAPAYPVVDFMDEDGTVYGALLLVREQQIGRVQAMELGAGYHCVTVPVRPERWHRHVDALAYHWPHEWVGPEVPGGDWNLEVLGNNRSTS